MNLKNAHRSSPKNDKGTRVCVLGAGSWGTALAHLLAENGAQVTLWARDQAAIEKMRERRENANYLPGVPLEGIGFSDDLMLSTQDIEALVLATPNMALADIAAQVAHRLAREVLVISGTKGLHPETGLRASQMWQNYDKYARERFVVLSGPNLAKEMAAGVPTSTVVAGENEASASRAQQLFNNRHFRVYTNTDVIGVELGGALKNVVALAAGIGDGLGYGDNSKAALMTRAWREMTRLAMVMGAQPGTLAGLSGFGDLMATCFSPQSRNRSLGERLGRGETLGFAQHEMSQIAEGVPTTRAALHLGRVHEVSMPVTEQVAGVLFEEKSPQRAVMELMSRQGCREE